MSVVAASMAGSSLAGVWKISSTVARSALPRHVRFGEPTRSAAAHGLLLHRRTILDAGTLSLPYGGSDCHGRWEVAEGDASDSGAMRASFVVEYSGHRDDAACTSWRFDGLFDGERIAGTVKDAAAQEVGDFLCTRLFSFWGTPQPRNLPND